MEWGINLESNKKKLNLSKKLISYLVMVMIGIIVIMALSINLLVEKKIAFYSSSIGELSIEALTKSRELFLQDISNLIIGISLLMIIIAVSISIFLSQKISKPIIVVSKMADFIKRVDMIKP